MDFEVKYKKTKPGFMGVKRWVAEVRFQVSGANCLVKVDNPQVMWWSMNGAGLFSTGDLLDTQRFLADVAAEVTRRNLDGQSAN